MVWWSRFRERENIIADRSTLVDPHVGLVLLQHIWPRVTLGLAISGIR